MAQKLLNYGPPLSDDEQYLIDQALLGAAQPQWNLYWSRVRFVATLTGSGPYIYSIATQTVQAFNYGFGASATVAGLPANATAADTSIQQPMQTINAENVLVRGVGLFLAPGSDPILAKQLDATVSVTVNLGPTKYKLGLPSFLPGPGGLTGFTESMIAQPPPTDAFIREIGGMSNGAPIAGNYLEFPRSLLWMPAGAGNASNFFVELQCQVAATQPVNTEGVADRTAEAQSSTFAGTNAWTHPAVATVFVDYVLLLNHVPFYTGG
jgi:hypothetical protein